MSNFFYLTLVTEPNHHLWLDALHARELSRKTKDNWNEGTYVRWTIISAWIVLEQCIEDALQDRNIGSRFRRNLDASLRKKRLAPLSWNKGVWKDVKDLKYWKNYYTHDNGKQRDLWPKLSKAEDAIKTARDAVKEIYTMVGKSYPNWIDRDNIEGYQ